MSRHASPFRALALLLALAACQSSPPVTRSLDPSADVVIPYAVSGGGEVRFTVRPRYAVVAPSHSAQTTVSWDGKSNKGELVPAQTYTISLDFVVGDQPVRLGSVIEIKPR